MTTIDGWYDRDRARERAPGARVPFAVLDADGAVVGTTRFMRMSEAQSRALEIGGTVYARRVQRTGRQHRGQAAAARPCVRCARLPVRPAAHRLRSTAQSRAAIERLGARMDGVLRGHHDAGRRIACATRVVYSILAHEWPGCGTTSTACSRIRRRAHDRDHRFYRHGRRRRRRVALADYARQGAADRQHRVEMRLHAAI